MLYVKKKKNRIILTLASCDSVASLIGIPIIWLVSNNNNYLSRFRTRRIMTCAYELLVYDSIQVKYDHNF